ncbi:hypothetical protein CRUP_033892, partial [Coryphaenoides rupestris]
QLSSQSLSASLSASTDSFPRIKLLFTCSPTCCSSCSACSFCTSSSWFFCLCRRRQMRGPWEAPAARTCGTTASTRTRGTTVNPPATT